MRRRFEIAIFHVERRYHDLKRRDGDGEDNSRLIMVKFDGCGQDAFDPYAVTPHNDRRRLALGGQDMGLHRFAVLGAELEDMTDLESLGDAQGAFAFRTPFALGYGAKIDPGGNFDIAFDADTAHVTVILIRARGHVLAAPQS